jgi:hypothetical protein
VDQHLLLHLLHLHLLLVLPILLIGVTKTTLAQVVLQTLMTVIATLRISPVFQTPLLILVEVVVTTMDPPDMVFLLSAVLVEEVLVTMEIGTSMDAIQMVVAAAIMTILLPHVVSDLTLCPSMIGTGTALTSIVWNCTTKLPSTAILVIALPHGRHMPPILGTSAAILHHSIWISTTAN